MASKLTSADISEVTRQSDVTSLQHRTNYTNLKNKTNELVDEIAAAAIGTTNAETTAARPYNTNLKERLDSITTGKPNYRGTITSLVTESSPAAMTVDIAADIGQINGITVNWSSATSGTITAPSANPRIDVVVANSDNTLTVVTGAEAATPVMPTIATTQLPLAKITLATSTTTITTSLITNYNGYVWSQIGEIIALHPDTKSAYLPNLYHYSPCDGVELFDTTFMDTGNDTNVPDLTDDRFLMGDTTYGSDNPTHNHKWCFYRVSTPTADIAIAGVNIGVNTVERGTYDTNGDEEDFVIGGPTDVRNNGYTTKASIKPNYFSVKYYMRIR